jgi:hypothetical protein
MSLARMIGGTLFPRELIGAPIFAPQMVEVAW